MVERKQTLVNGLYHFKVIESVDEEEDHKLLDLFVLFVLYGVPGNCKSIRNVIVNKVKAKKFTESILAQFFQHQIPVGD